MINLNEFSLSLYYGSRTYVPDYLLLPLFAIVTLAVPLPFGSIESLYIFVIELTAAVLFLLWLVKLLFCGNQEQRKLFREVHRSSKAEFQQAPFFHRHPWIRRICRGLSLGNWPKKNRADNLDSKTLPDRLAFFNVLGFPVRNTGMEKIACLFLILILLQTIPLPAQLVRIVSPASAELYQSAANVTDAKVNFHPLSVNASNTFSKFLEYTAYFVIYLVIVNSHPTGTYLRVILVSFIISVAFQSAYGLFEFASGRQQIFNFKKVYNDYCATGTFINRNHYAAYLGISLPTLLALLVERSIARNGKKLSGITRWLQVEGGKPFLFLTLILVSSISIVYSFSRSGVIFSAATCALFLVLRRSGRSKSTWIRFLGPCLIILVAIAAGIGPLSDRFAKIAEELTATRARSRLYADTFRIFMDYPLFGSGAGSFMEVFPIYRSFMTGDWYRHAHNDYLQFLSETGIFFVIVMIVVTDLFFRRTTKLLDHPKRPTTLEMGLICSFLALTMHGFSNFAFQIPAIAVTGILLYSFILNDDIAKRRHL